MEENVSQKDKEKVEEEMIEQAFQQLLNDYLATKHRKRIEIITKAFNFANQAHKGIKRNRSGVYIHLCSITTRCGGRYRLYRRGHREYIRSENRPDCRWTDQNIRWYLR